MTMLTQSGAAVIPNYGNPQIQRLVVAGVSIAPGVLAGDVHTVLGWVAQRFNDTVRPLKAGQCWGYAPRQIRGGTGWSNHASGTAIDLNAADLPQGQRRLSAAEVRGCQAIVTQSHGAIRWGGDYGGSTAVDQQHFEITSLAAAHTFAATLGATPTVQGDDVTPQDIKAIAAEVVNQLMAEDMGEIKDAANATAANPDGATPYTFRTLQQRLIRLTGLTQAKVR